MKTKKILRFIGSAALAALVIHLSLTPLHAGVAVSIGQNYTDTTSSIDAPPDPAGTAGANYIVAINRNAFTVYNKADGSVAQTMSDVDFWTSAGITLYSSTCVNGPRVVYDPTVQRWFAAQVLGNCDLSWAAARLQLAVSETADPTAQWNAVTITNTPGSSNDFGDVVVGLDAQGVYLAEDVWPTNPAASNPIGCALWSAPKVDLLAIPPIITNATWFGDLSTNYGYSLTPAICFDGSARGDALAAASTGENHITYGPLTNETLIGADISNANGPGAATLGAPLDLRVLPYTEPINWAAQPDGSANLVDGDAEFVANMYCVDGVLFAVHALQYGPHIALRWYRIRAGDYQLLEAGTISDPNLDLYFPSIAGNSNGTVVVACDGSSIDQFVSCYAVVGQTAGGVTAFGSPLLLQTGFASYQNLEASGQLYATWGDYSTICPDPADQNVFWTFNAYADGPATWATQVTQLLTSPSPQLSIASMGTNVLLSWPVTDVPFQLESAPSLTGSNSWSPVTTGVTTTGAIVSVLVPAASSATFFRLVHSQ